MNTVEQGRALAETSGIVVTTPLLEWTAAQIVACAVTGHRRHQPCALGGTAPVITR